MKSILIQFLLLFSFISVCYAQHTDSTRVVPHKVLSVMPTAQPDLTQCVVADNDVTIWLGGTSAWTDWKQGNCANGYIAYGFMSKVRMVDGNGFMQWQHYCCKVKVGY